MSKERIVGAIATIGGLSAIGYGFYNMKVVEKNLKKKTAKSKVSIGLGGVAVIIGFFWVRWKWGRK